MEFIKEIKVDLHKAMKSEEKDKVVTLRSLLAKLKDKQISLG